MGNQNLTQLSVSNRKYSLLWGFLIAGLPCMTNKYIEYMIFPGTNDCIIVSNKDYHSREQSIFLSIGSTYHAL